VQHDDIARRLRLGIHWPGYAEAAPPPPPRERGREPGGLLDDLASVHEAAHATFAHENGQRIYDVSVEKGGHGGGEFRHVPNARDPATDPKEIAGEKISMMIATRDEATARAWRHKLIGFAVGRAAQRRYGATNATYDEMCEGDYLVIDRVLDAITSDPVRQREYLREIEEKAEAFVNDHWQKILRLAKETLRRGRLTADEIATVLAPVHAAAKPSDSDGFRAVPDRVAASFHEAAHALVSIRMCQTVEECTIDERGGGWTRTRDDPQAPGDERGALQRFCVMALAGGAAVERLTGRPDDQAHHDLADVKRRIAHLPTDEQATFMREARAAAQRVVDRDWALLTELARHLHRRGALDQMDVLNVLNLAPSRRAA
jgi:hypothetical protein